LKEGEKMRDFFRQLINGNLPEGFSLIRSEKYFYLYRTNPTKEQIVAFNNRDANSEVVEKRLKKIFVRFGYRLNKKTKMWEH
jgi:hypothetical protein